MHIQRHTSAKSVACPKCPKRFFDKHGLKSHMQVHDDAQFVCDICGSVMRSKASYMEHKSIIILTNCKQRYKTNLNSESFLYSTGRHKKSKVYTCEVCSKQIKTSLYNLKLHMYTHTGEKRKF